MGTIKIFKKGTVGFMANNDLCDINGTIQNSERVYIIYDSDVDGLNKNGKYLYNPDDIHYDQIKYNSIRSDIKDMEVYITDLCLVLFRPINESEIENMTVGGRIVHTNDCLIYKEFIKNE